MQIIQLPPNKKPLEDFINLQDILYYFTLIFSSTSKARLDKGKIVSSFFHIYLFTR